ncbi:MAG: tetratricopeptide repeat protein [Candidatus Thermoplasmatota archaeon]
MKKQSKKKRVNNNKDGADLPIVEMVNFLLGSRRQKREGRRGQWLMKSVGDHEWMFLEPLEFDDVYDSFDDGCEFLEQGAVGRAEQLFRDVLRKAPLHIDALHHLAIILDEQGKKTEALQLWEQGVAIGRQAFPKTFAPGDRLEWGWLENRPFLRCLHGLALAVHDAGDAGRATCLLEELLSYNPDDNQGVRELLMGRYLETQQYQKAVLLGRKYPGDGLPGVLYGFPLALFRLGRYDQAKRKLLEAVKYSPKIAKELLKKNHKPPKSDMPGYITVGGWDEAYEYWRCFGRFWDEEALQWLRDTTKIEKIQLI